MAQKFSIKQISNAVRYDKAALVSFCILIAFALAAVTAPLLTPFDPDAIDLVDARMIPPSLFRGGHWLGTDSSGRDLFSRLLFGARLSLVLGILPVLIACFIGVPVGLVSGFSGGKTDEFLMRVNDCLLAFPSILLALIVVAFLGQGIFNLMCAVGLSYVPTFARVVRGAVLAETSKDYIVSASSLGASKNRILFRHLLPNITNSLVVLCTLNFAGALLEAAGLSFLGLGVQPPTAEWGSMLADGKNYFYDGWWMLVFPGIAIFLVVLCLNVLGDCLRDALDPRTLKKG